MSEHAQLILDALDEMDETTIEAFTEYCANNIEAPYALVAALVPLTVGACKWDGMRNAIGQRCPELAEALREIVHSIDKLQAAFIESRAAWFEQENHRIKEESV